MASARILRLGLLGVAVGVVAGTLGACAAEPPSKPRKEAGPQEADPLTPPRPEAQARHPIITSDIPPPEAVAAEPEK